MIGRVKWFSNAKGFGFIGPLNGGADVFVHHTAIAMAGYRTLREGEVVVFEIARGPRGPQATNVQKKDLAH